MESYGMEECDVCFDLVDTTNRRHYELVDSYNVCCFMCISCYERMLDMTEEQLDHFFPPHIRRKVVNKYEGIPFIKWISRFN
ncbi:hypothetical protein [Lysinibacillus odysseyi]|uniref:Uncharacterized protein n=2 Tax=Lysinibacillus odysseyi TaxID=202611 RepID=A0A0A3IM30_9BACI|nr:hypothetical protein [Lysinibacillus odysseyi]KGR85824.1 hypothetical protein CD32_08230 [Lysinibacillus odysseyi 34hs-1 = NBRC 100172]